MPRLASPSLKQLGTIPYAFPQRVEDHPFTQQVQAEEDVHDPAILGAVWNATKQAYRTDLRHEVPFNQTFSYGIPGTKRSNKTYLQQDVPIISAEIKRYIAQQVKYSLWGYITNDPRLNKYLVANSPAGAAAPIHVEVEAGDQLKVTIRGPYWLQFYFTGARGHTITGHNPRARNMLVFYGRSGDKIVVPSVYMPPIKPGLYVEKAIADTLAKVKFMASSEVSKDVEGKNADTQLQIQLQEAKAYLAAQEKWVKNRPELAQQREFFLNIQRKMSEASAELSRLSGEMRRRRQFRDPNNPVISSEADLDKIPTDSNGNAALIYGRDPKTNEMVLVPNPAYTGVIRGGKRTDMLNKYHEALATYLSNYIIHTQLTGSNESRIRDVVMREHMRKGPDGKIAQSRIMVNEAVKQLRELKPGIKIRRRKSHARPKKLD